MSASPWGGLDQSMRRETPLDTPTCQDASAGSRSLAGLTIVQHPGTEPVIIFASSTFPLDMNLESHNFSGSHRSLCLRGDRCFEWMISSSDLQMEKLA